MSQNQTIELTAKDCVFHFNKGHLADPTIPMWVLKIKGKAYYINHLDADIPFSTKETPDNPSTKGAIKFKRVNVIIDENQNATLRPATALDLQEQKQRDNPPQRVVTENITEAERVMKQHNIQHDPVMSSFSNGTRKHVFDVKSDKELSKLILTSKSDMQILNKSDALYKQYTELRSKQNH